MRAAGGRSLSISQPFSFWAPWPSAFSPAANGSCCTHRRTRGKDCRLRLAAVRRRCLGCGGRPAGGLASWLLLAPKTIPARAGSVGMLLGAVLLVTARDIHGPPILAGAGLAWAMLRKHEPIREQDVAAVSTSDTRAARPARRPCGPARYANRPAGNFPACACPSDRILLPATRRHCTARPAF